MSHKTRSFLALTKASLKMYYRNKGAIVFTLLIPVSLLLIFGFLSKGGGTGSIKLAVTNHSETALSKGFVESLKKIGNFSVIETSEADARKALGKGDLDLQVIVPAGFGDMQTGKRQRSTVATFYNKGKPQGGQMANMVVVEMVSGFDKQLSNAPTILDVKSEGITTNQLGYFDFILPGILAMTIMQLGIFSVAFSFVALKASGALRRIQATPVHPMYFVFAQAVVRLLVALSSAALLLLLGIYFFNFHMMGSYLEFAIMVIIGILIFLGIGFAIAGWAKDETQVAPVANLIQLPMLMLSGIFFSRDGFPSWIRAITDYFPLTYLSHGLRKISNDGASLTDIPVDLAGSLVWLVIVYVIAVKVFKWE